ncbi:twin-arginine translocase TatA/TatE family subunit [Microbacterium sp. NIBRBAC000506063]|uniref:twin-arginine translocase TatA/TatE family subunit n=1 Tax=Microbacterium sp. NIBRBAC000506063 TaxID=2734618 RepID=UPI001BB6A2E4|nr:twin-arginine translocase TatA/TatE family subunit [Microbacterium sp. NIBRBAC000506063]QTV80824.1 twin-arginine translocase TatA/TatE family subunit [Microbacterium sp. NIBRBAC000506063]
MGGNLMGWPTLLIILVVIILLFGAAKLPALAKSVGQSARVFKGEMKAMKDEDAQRAESSAADAPEAKGSPAAATDPDSPDRSA